MGESESTGGFDPSNASGVRRRAEAAQLLTQFVCASVFLLSGIGMLVYGIRALTGTLPESMSPWGRRKGTWPVEEERRQSIVLGIAIVMGGTVLFVGGVGLMVVSLL